MKVAIIMGSDSDWPILEPAYNFLKSFGIESEVHVASAHRTPSKVREIVTTAGERKIGVFIVAAGAAAHLAGVVASYTVLPVVAIPVNATSLNGLDALLATVQMPSGVPVATMAVNGGKNAAIFAAQILALSNSELAQKLADYRQKMQDEVEAKNQKLQASLQ